MLATTAENDGVIRNTSLPSMMMEFIRKNAYSIVLAICIGLLLTAVTLLTLIYLSITES